MADWIKKKNSHICCQRETHFKSKDTHRLKVGMETGIWSKGNKKKIVVAILVSEM